MIALEYIACIFHIIACITGSEEIRQIANCIQLIADLVWCSVCACMQVGELVSNGTPNCQEFKFSWEPCFCILLEFHVIWPVSFFTVLCSHNVGHAHVDSTQDRDGSS